MTVESAKTGQEHWTGKPTGEGPVRLFLWVKAAGPAARRPRRRTSGTPTTSSTASSASPTPCTGAPDGGAYARTPRRLSSRAR